MLAYLPYLIDGANKTQKPLRKNEQITGRGGCGKS